MDYASDRTCHVLSAVKDCLNIRKHNDDSWLRKQSLFTVTWAWHRDRVAWFADITTSSNHSFPPDDGTRWNRAGSPAGVWCFSWRVTQTHVHTKKLMFSSQQTLLTGTSSYLPVRTEMAEEGHDRGGVTLMEIWVYLGTTFHRKRDMVNLSCSTGTQGGRGNPPAHAALTPRQMPQIKGCAEDPPPTSSKHTAGPLWGSIPYPKG